MTTPEQTFEQCLQYLEENADAQVIARLMLLYGQRHPRGTLLRLEWTRVADALVALLAARLQKQPTCSLVLSGGKTPEALYQLLATRPYQHALDWTRVHLFWGDERYVPHDDPRSNYHLAFNAWLRDAPVPPENRHPMPTHYADPDDAARAYEATLRAYFDDTSPFPTFDLILLGLGEDGHIASLFPGDPALDETTRWVVPSRSPVEPRQRLTLTLPLLNATPRIWFLIAGESKRAVLERVLTEEPDPNLPAARITPGAPRFWWLSPELYPSATTHAET